MKITIIGVGYVGLTFGLVLCKKGNEVYFYDNDKKKIDLLKNGVLPIKENGLDDILNQLYKKCSFFSKPGDYIRDSDIIFICVGTPILEDGLIDTSYFKKVVNEISSYLSNRSVLVVKSTITPDHIIWCKNFLNKNFNFLNFAVNPEFLREGNALYDAENPSRIIIGVENEFSKEKLLSLYKDFNSPIIITDPISASIIKYASNSFLATKISFINEIANLCDILGADINDVAIGMGLDPRIGKNYLNAGIGYGGSCLPKDTKAFIRFFKDNGLKFNILESVNYVNENQYKIVIKKLEKYLGKLEGKNISIFGLAFKGGTDDVRESIALKIIKELINLKVNIKAHDYWAIDNAKKILPSISYFYDVYDASIDADAIVIATDWKEYKDINWEMIKKLMRGNLIIDGKNILNYSEVIKIGFIYEGIGRRKI